MENILYHYTDWLGLDGILCNQSKKCVLRATNIQFLTDFSEIDYGLKLVQKVVSSKEIKDKKYSNALLEIEKRFTFEDLIKLLGYEIAIFVCSLSRIPDEFNMWKSYSDNAKGVAIGLDKDAVKAGLGEPLRICNYKEEDIIKDLEFYLFEEQNLFKILEGLSNPENLNNARLALNLLIERCIRYKHKAFSYENEYRLIKKNPDTLKTHFRNKNGRLIPYFEFEFELNCIKDIWIGPNCDQKKNEYSLKKLKEKLKLNFEIKMSNIPYRTI